MTSLVSSIDTSNAIAMEIGHASAISNVLPTAFQKPFAGSSTYRKLSNPQNVPSAMS